MISKLWSTPRQGTVLHSGPGTGQPRSFCTSAPLLLRRARALGPPVSAKAQSHAEQQSLRAQGRPRRLTGEWRDSPSGTKHSLLTWPRAPLLAARLGSALSRRSWAGTPGPARLLRGCAGGRCHTRPGPALPFSVAFRGTPGRCWLSPTPPGAGARKGDQTFLLGLSPPALLQVQLADQPPALL